MHIQVYAVLKDYFDAAFEIQEPVFSIDDLKQKLITMKPSTEKILRTCRFAVNDSFIDNEYKFSTHDRVAIIPPASGG